MPITETTLGELVERENAALARFVALAETVDPHLPVGEDTWRATDVVAHLGTVIHRCVRRPRPATTPDEVAEINAEELAELGASTMAEFVTELSACQTRYQERWRRLPLEDELPFHAGIELDVATLRANWVSELCLQGWDLAQAAGLPWPLDDRDALLALRVVLRAMPAWLKGEELGSFALRVEVDGGVPQVLVMRNATVEVVDRAVPDAAAVVGGAPAAAALLFYGRLDLDAAVAEGLVVTGDVGAVRRLLASRFLP